MTVIERKYRFYVYVWEGEVGGFFFIDVKNYAWFWLKFHCPALPGGLVVLIKLFYWCGLLEDTIRSCLLFIQGVTTLIFMPRLPGKVNPMLALR